MIASIIFKAAFDNNLYMVTLELQDLVKDDRAYLFASQGYSLIGTIDANKWDLVVNVYIVSL
jgi:hypothetical protein